MQPGGFFSKGSFLYFIVAVFWCDRFFTRLPKKMTLGERRNID
jgi:hypothetical protein